MKALLTVLALGFLFVDLQLLYWAGPTAGWLVSCLLVDTAILVMVSYARGGDDD